MGIVQSTGRLISVIALCVFILGFVYGAMLLYVIAFFGIAVLLVASVFAWVSARGVECRREIRSSAVFSDYPLTTKIQLYVPKGGAWRLLEVSERVTNTITGVQTRRGMNVLVGASADGVLVDGEPVGCTTGGDALVVEMADILRFPHRGLYRIGPLMIHSNDPMGMLRFTRTIPTSAEVLVYPRPLQMGYLAVHGGANGELEEAAHGLVAREHGSDYHAVRPYVQGDDMRRIHWKATAHLGNLTVKEYDPMHDRAIYVVLDLAQGMHMGRGHETSLEVAVTLAASLLHEACDNGTAVGVITTGSQLGRISPGLGQRHYLRVLEALALARDDGTKPLAQILAGGEPRVHGRCALVLITPAVSLDLISILPDVQRRASSLVVVSLNARSFLPPSVAATGWQRTLAQVALSEIDWRVGVRQPRGMRPSPVDQHQVFLRAATHAGLELLPVAAGQQLPPILEELRLRLGTTRGTLRRTA